MAADITAKLFWYRSRELFWAMADKLTDIVYTDDSKETINVINLLLLGWILLGLVVFIIGNVVATYLRKKKSLVCSKPETPTTADENNESAVPCANDIIERTEVVRLEPQQTIIPTCEGDDEEFCEWINNVTRWIYTNKVVSPIIESWLTALNARTRLSSTEHGILVDFRDLLHTSGPPKVTEVRQSAHARYDNTVCCDMEFEDIAFEVVVTQFKGKEKLLLPFVLQVRRLQGKVGIECNPEDVSFVAKYSEPPQIDLYPEVSNDTEVAPEDYIPLCDVVAEISNDALSSAILPLRLSCFPDCPRMHTSTSQEDRFEVAESESERRLLVKVVKATHLGGAKGCRKPYCVVEMDDPPQRFETSAAEGTDSPFWDEGFTFSVKDPAELLFEIYDKDSTEGEDGGFLGLGLVGVEELLRHPSQRQIIPLQSRPLQEDDVSGALTVEFLFLDRPSPVLEGTRFGPLRPPNETASREGKTVETNSRVTAGGTLITTTTIQRTKEECRTIAPEPKPNPKANPNLHATEEMLHPQTPNTHNELAVNKPTTNELVASLREDIVTVLHQTVNENETGIQSKIDQKSDMTVEPKSDSATQNSVPFAIQENFPALDETLHSLNEKESFDLPQSDPEAKLLDPIVEFKLDSVNRNSIPLLNPADCENLPIPDEARRVDLHAHIVDQIFESLVQESDRYSDVHANISDQKVLPSTNGKLHAEIDDQNVALLATHEHLESLVGNEQPDQNGYCIPESQIYNQANNNISISTRTASEHNPISDSAKDVFQKDSEHSNGVAAQNGGAPKTSNKNVPVIKPPALPSILIKDSPPKDESVEGSPPIKVEKSMDGEEGGAGVDLAGTALQQLGKGQKQTATSKSTLIIHSVQRPESSVSGSVDNSPAHNSVANNSRSEPSSPAPHDSSQEEYESRGRPKEKRSLLGTLRRRLSFHRGRSKSANQEAGSLEQSRASSRSASTDRIRQTPISPFKGGRFLGGQLLSPTAAGSTRSSLSEASGISASSAKTYVNDNSTLVVETNENGIVKRYLIPNSLIHRSKWKKRGTKLHIYNDHVFVARHLSGSTQCQVCSRHLTRRPGKQGYECRGCDLQCHKSCHVKVDTYCTNSAVNAMEVEYIHDPKGASPKSI